MSKAASDTLEKVSGEFQAEVLGILEDGRKETLARVESARKEAAESVAKIIESSLKQAESVKRQIVGSAELQARNAQLRSLERAVNESFEGATKKISSSRGEDYERALGRLIQEGLDVIGPNASVRCATKDRKAVSSEIRKLAKSKVVLDDEPVETIGGVVMTTPDGNIRFDNTLEARLDRMRPSLRKEVAALLTGA